MTNEQIVAIGFLTRRDLDTLGAAFDRAFPLESVACFDELIVQLDEAGQNIIAVTPATPVERETSDAAAGDG